MLRRPLAAVLSSASIRSRISTRLFCATANSTDDHIPTVRTTGIPWKSDNGKGDLIGVYWGEGDPRNTKKRLYGLTGFHRSKLVSIVMALDQAMADGLKRIRVQSDLQLNPLEIRATARKYKNMNFKTRQKLNLSEFHYCERIVKIMDEIEVVLQYRSAWSEIAGSTDNEVLQLLSDDFKRKNPDLNTVDFTSPEYESDWTITPTDVSPLEGRTVPTVYVAGKLFNGNTAGMRASLWVPESIEHLDIIQRPLGSIHRSRNFPITLPRTKLSAIRAAIKEAQILILPEIRVVTDSLNFIRFFKSDWKKKDGSYHANEAMYLDIKALTETTKVHFKGVTEDCDDEILKEVYEKTKVAFEMPERKMKRTCNSDWTITPSEVSPLEGRTVPTVYVAAKRHSTILGASASLWVPESIEHLEMKQRPLGSIQRMTIYPVKYFATQLTAIREAIKEAQNHKLPEIQVLTDCNPFEYFFTRDWKDEDGSPVACENLYLEIKALTETIKVHFKAVRLTGDSDDELVKKVREMAKEGLKYPLFNKNEVKESGDEGG